MGVGRGRARLIDTWPYSFPLIDLHPMPVFDSVNLGRGLETSGLPRIA